MLTTVTDAVAGTFRDLTGLSDAAFTGAEPVWLLAWGVALISLAGMLRVGVSARIAASRESKKSEAQARLSATERSVAGAA